MAVGFHVIMYATDLGWLLICLIGPALVFEFGNIRVGILKQIHFKSVENQALIQSLVRSLDSNTFSIFILVVLHSFTLWGTYKWMNLFLALCFVANIYQKLYMFNQFMIKNHLLALSYKKDPESI